MATGITQFDGAANRIELSDGSVSYVAEDGQNYSRTGMRSIENLARRLCSTVNGTSLIIRKVFGDSDIIMLLLELIQALCAVLIEVTGGVADGTPATAYEDSKQQLIADLRSVLDKYDDATV